MTIWIITSWPYSPSRSPWWWWASPRTMSMVEWRDSTTTWNPACSTSHFSCLMFYCLLHLLCHRRLILLGLDCDSQAASGRRTACTRVENMISWGSGRLGGMTESDAEGWKLWQGETQDSLIVHVCFRFNIAMSEVLKLQNLVLLFFSWSWTTCIFRLIILWMSIIEPWYWFMNSWTEWPTHTP